MSGVGICYGCMRQREDSFPVCPYCGFDYEKYMREKSLCYLNPGEMLKGKYLLGKVLGAGGFGITYMGYDLTLQIPIAVKEYFPTEYASRNVTGMTHYSNAVMETQSSDIFGLGLEKFLNEARILAHFNKIEGVVTVTDFFYENNTGYMIMEYLPGKSLKEIVLSRNLPMGENEVRELIMPILDVLEEIHKEGLIHRDISPENLIMNENGRLVLIDFGAAREISEYSASLTVVLKQGYAPLEQYTTAGKQGPWTDIYAICATIYFMVTHAVPQTATDRAMEDDLISLADLGMNVSGRFSAAVQKGLAVRYVNRYQNIKELKNGLNTPEPAIQPTLRPTPPVPQPTPQPTPPVPQPTLRPTPPVPQPTPQPTPPPTPQPTPPPVPRPAPQKWIFALLTIFCLLLMAGGGYYVVTNVLQEAEVKKKDGGAGVEKIEGTFATYKSVDMKYIPIYEETGDGKKSGKLPEGVCCQAKAQKNYEGKIWYKIDYCGLSGWVEGQYLRKISSEKWYFYLKEDQEKNIVFNNEEKIKLHTEPDKKSDCTAKNVPYGTEFEVSKLKKGWAKTKYKGQECWLEMYVAGAYVSDYWQVEICNGSKSKKQINLRKKAKEESDSLAHIPAGTVLQVTEFKKGWGKTTYRGKTGWIKLHYATPCSSDGLPFSEDTE